MYRQRFLLSLCLTCAALLLAGCAKNDPVPEGMYVTVSFGEVHRCSRVSPEIIVHNPPKGTDYYDIRVSVAETERTLGGGMWAGKLNEDGDLVIPEGGLTKAYRGPCPSRGKAEERSFAFVVYAMSRASSSPLAVSSCMVSIED